MGEKVERPWWHPVRANKDYCDRLRRDYPEETGDMDDESLRDHYNEDSRRKYAVTWDHVGDAYDEYEAIVDDWYALRTAIAAGTEKRERAEGAMSAEYLEHIWHLLADSACTPWHGTRRQWEIFAKELARARSSE